MIVEEAAEVLEPQILAAAHLQLKSPMTLNDQPFNLQTVKNPTRNSHLGSLLQVQDWMVDFACMGQLGVATSHALGFGALGQADDSDWRSSPVASSS